MTPRPGDRWVDGGSVVYAVCHRSPDPIGYVGDGIDCSGEHFWWAAPAARPVDGMRSIFLGSQIRMAGLDQALTKLVGSIR